MVYVKEISWLNSTWFIASTYPVTVVKSLEDGYQGQGGCEGATLQQER